MEYENIDTPIELYEFMLQNMNYGFVSSYDNKIYCRSELNNDELYEQTLFSSYYLQTPTELLKNKYGICYDQVELERDWFTNHGYKVLTYYTPFHNHAFLVYIDDKGYHLFERTIKNINGIYTKDNLKELLKYYKFLQLGRTKIYLTLYNYNHVNFGCNMNEFIDNAKSEKKILVI